MDLWLVMDMDHDRCITRLELEDGLQRLGLLHGRDGVDVRRDEDGVVLMDEDVDR
jgi:hypothetical protein